MRKFVLTSSKMEGQIEIVFNENEISIVDFSKAKLTVEQRDYFLRHVAVCLFDLEAFVKQSRFTCVEADIEITFEMFWDKYAFKVDRKRAEKIWDKMSKAKKISAFYGIDRYDRYLRRTADWRNKMEPKTYLKNERWEDEWR